MDIRTIGDFGANLGYIQTRERKIVFERRSRIHGLSEITEITRRSLEDVVSLETAR